jgi:hypothetical protein
LLALSTHSGVDVADNYTLMKVGLFGGAAYLAYKFGYLNFLLPATVATGTPATGAPASPAAAAPAAPAPPAPAKVDLNALMFNTLKAGVSATGNKDNPMMSPDDWNALARQTPNVPALPDPNQLFGNRDPMIFGTWWSKTVPYLQAQGLAGYLRSRGVRV